MLNFLPCTADSLRTAEKYLNNSPFLCNDLTVGSLFMWRKEMEPAFCVVNDTLIVRQLMGGYPAFSWPIGKDVDGALDALLEHVSRQDLPMRFFGLDEETVEKIRRGPRFSGVMSGYDSRWSDYIYSADEMAAFSGKRFSGQRNHINKFTKLYGEPDVRPLLPEDRDRAMAMLSRYQAEHTDAALLERLELIHARELLEVYDKIGMLAACLVHEGQIIALSIGEVAGDMLCIHVEKALRTYEGAYPAMFRGYVRYVRDHLSRPVRIVNREDDSGNPGLRTSKQQYHPIGMVHKYQLHAFTPAARLESIPVLKTERLALTPFRGEDREAYLRLNTDVENNRWWGYDYRDDFSVIQPVDENTFFDSVRYDMEIGDSVNFAVRESEDGPMIGEAVLWNFTRTGVEAGCRLFREYQGKRYGSEAIKAAAELAARSMDCTVRARCFRDNVPSQHMLLHSGFHQIRSDNAYYYYQYR